MKKPEDGNGVFVMKKLTTRGLQALAGGPSRLRSGSSKAAGTDPVARLAAEPVRPPQDSLNEVTIPRADVKAPIALATNDEIDAATRRVEAAKPKLRDEDIETLLQQNPMTASSPRPAAGLSARDDERAERTALMELPKPAPAMAPQPAAAAKSAAPQMSLRTPPTLIHAQQAIPDDIRQLAIRALEAQKAGAPPPSVGAVALPMPPSSQPAVARSTVTPLPQKPQPGAPQLVKTNGKVQIVVRETKRRTAAGWSAMLVALGVFIGLSTVAIVHGDARHAWEAVKGSASQKQPEPPAAVAAAATPAPTPAPEPVVAATPTEPVAPATAPGDTKLADNGKPSDVKDESKTAPKPEPKPEVTKPDPAPKPQVKPSNAYASARPAAPKPAAAAVAAADDDKPAKAAAKPEAIAAAPKPKPEPVAAKPKDPPAKPAAAPAPAPAPGKGGGGDDDVAKISQMAQQQLGAALP